MTHTCRHCFRVFDRKYNCQRHENTCKCKDDAKVQNVAPEVQNVAPEVQNVALEVQNVALEVQNVAPEAQNVAPEVQDESDDDTTKESCIFCYKEFMSKKSLMRHVSRCKGTNHPFMCPKCSKIFTNRKSKSKHCKKCHGNSSEIVPKESSSAAPSQDILALSCNEPVMGQLPLTTTNQNVVHAHDVTLNQNTLFSNNNIQQNIQQNIHINCFGKEDLEGLLSPEYLDARLRELNGKGIYRIVEDAHFHKERPQNHNIRMGSRKRKLLRIKEEDGWKMRANADILDTLIGNYKRVLTNRSFEPDFRKKYEDDFLQIQQDLQKFDKRSNPTEYFKCCRKILALIENMETNTSSKEL